MAKTIEEQIAGKCKHFTGIMENKTCKAGVAYDDVKKFQYEDKTKIPLQLPCFKDSGLCNCDKVEFHTPEEAAAKAKEMLRESNRSLKILFAAKDHFNKTKANTSKFKCPNGEHLAAYTRTESNGHFWIFCKTCDVRINE